MYDSVVAENPEFNLSDSKDPWQMICDFNRYKRDYERLSC